MKLTPIETVFGGMVVGVGGAFQQAGFGGISMADPDLVVTLSLSAGASFIAALDGERGVKSFALNFALGLLVGVLFAHLVVTLFAWPPLTLYSLAPLAALFGAKLGRAFISDDTVVETILSWIKGKFAKKDAGE